MPLSEGLLEGTMTRKNVEPRAQVASTRREREREDDRAKPALRRLVTMLDPRGETPDREIARAPRVRAADPAPS